MDIIEVEILEDGTLKSTTGRVSMANHSAADKFFLELARYTGGVSSRIRRALHHVHSHITGDHHHEHSH